MPSSSAEFDGLVAPHRQEIHCYCYRVLGSLADADEALQEALLDAWRGLAGFDGRGTPRAWLFRIATRACIRVAERRPKRITAPELGPPTADIDVSSRDSDQPWLDPYPTDPSWRYEALESIELAYIAALQTLAPKQRAALILCDVVGLSAEEAAQALDTSVAATNSALQRARATLTLPGRTQQATLRELGSAREAELVRRFVAAWERSDVDALVALMAEDARFTMPPLRTWLAGRAAIVGFIRRCSRHPWKLESTRANGQLAFVFRQGPEWGVGSLNVLTLDGPAIAEMTAFLDPAVHGRFLSPDTDEFLRLPPSYAVRPEMVRPEGGTR
jgi:RNA polymerase sigma-70 factor (ECF subfamily)